ncbi:hypothetical protein XENOCAPTIV_025513 [Xenoophorus captivus]|uniref:Uncharacterized protein n=1 Tax=Xenoophorus captivus TaxID=1517983 RepID=A0ABV0RV27_9TELE
MALPSLLTEPFPVFDLKSLFRAISPHCSAFMIQLGVQRDEDRPKIGSPFTRRNNMWTQPKLAWLWATLQPRSHSVCLIQTLTHSQLCCLKQHNIIVCCCLSSCGHKLYNLIGLEKEAQK